MYSRIAGEPFTCAHAYPATLSCATISPAPTRLCVVITLPDEPAPAGDLVGLRDLDFEMLRLLLLRSIF